MSLSVRLSTNQVSYVRGVKGCDVLRFPYIVRAPGFIEQHTSHLRPPLMLQLIRMLSGMDERCIS